MDIGKYLNEMEIPQRFIEAMTSTSSTDMWWLSSRDADSLSVVPSIEEWLRAACGGFGFSFEKDCKTEKILSARDAIPFIDCDGYRHDQR